MGRRTRPTSSFERIALAGGSYFGDGQFQGTTGQRQVYRRERSWSNSPGSSHTSTNGYRDETLDFQQGEHDVKLYQENNPSKSVIHHSWGYGSIEYGVLSLCRSYAATHHWSRDAQAQSGAWDKLSDVQWDAAVDFAEGRETIGMVKSLLGDIVGVARAAHGLAFRPIQNFPRLAASLRGAANRRMLKELANRWLQYHYGIAPIINSIEDARKYFASEVADLAVHKKVKRRVITDFSFSSSSYELGYGGTWFNGPGPFSINGAVTCTRYATVVRNTAPYNPMDDLGFDSLARVGWELVPLSFVVDWAVNVGNYLANRVTASRFDVLDGGRSSLVDMNFAHQAKFSTGSQYKGFGQPATVAGNFRSYIRQPATLGLGVVTSNPFSGNAATTRAISALALSAQRLLR